MIKKLIKESLLVKVYENRKLMGIAAAEETIQTLNMLLSKKNTVNIIFAAAPSQNEFLAELSSTNSVEWNRVNAFHMDEYIGLGNNAPQGFGNFLNEKLFSKVNFKNVYLLNGQSEDIDKECKRYEKLLRQNKIDITCCGIGENSHLAFNDPDIALFNDLKLVKKVELDYKCRNQQVNDGCFESIDEVPKYAITLTIPALVSAQYVFCIVPAKSKAFAVSETINAEVTQEVPSSILRKHDNATLYLDNNSSSLL